jgi:acetyl esterase/lipase
MAPTPFPVRVLRDLQFAAPAGVPLGADLYIPQGVHEPLPAIVWVHGGGWRYGNRRLSPDLSRVFADRGFAMAAVDYRLSSHATFPAQIEDLKTAVRWLRSIAPTHGFDSDRVGLMGVSAGGHLCALAGLAPETMFEPTSRLYSEYSSRVRAVVAAYAPIDFLQLDAHRAPDGTVSDDPENLPMPRGMRSADANSFESLLLGAPIGTCPDRVHAANPIRYVGPDAPPFLILHGASDTTVPLHQSEILYRALAAHGTEVTLSVIEGLGHGFLSRKHLDDGPPRPMVSRRHLHGEEQVDEQVQPIFPMVEAFLRAHLKKAGPARVGA